jgi:hypothetical protein
VIELLDGPAKGTFTVRRAPVYLRATISKLDGRRDVLDQLEDEPLRYEDVYVYRLDRGTHGVVYVRPGGCFESGLYRLVEPQPDQRDVRANAAWRAWVDEQQAVAS